jgi:hypothetical protein
VELSKSEVKRWAKRILPVFIGIIGGYAYYHFIGCASGACPIISNPYFSMIYGGLIGAVLAPREWKYSKNENTNS